ncbi:MAG: CheR family methyltransferase, partial [Polyangiaceae bacterium]
AGSSSGEEAYTIAMILREGALPAGWTATIRGADLSPAVVERARAGRYTAWSLRDVPRPTRERWFTRSGKEFILEPSIRSMVTFYERNLTRDDPQIFAPELYDVIFCRNVVMYFTPAQLQSVIDRLARSLVPGGYLFLGHAETLRGVTQDFRLCHTHNTFYYRKGGPESATKIVAALAVEPPPSVDTSTSWVDAVQHAAERIRTVTSTPSGPPPPAARRPAELEAALDLLANERFAEALTILASLPREAKLDPDAVLLRAVLETHAGHVANAETACHELLALDEMHAGAHYVLALCRENVGDAKGATDHDRTAAYLDPTFAMPRLHLGIMARRAGDNDTARTELERALVLLQREDASRVVLFGGGFQRQGLVTLCRAELFRLGGDDVRRA